MSQLCRFVFTALAFIGATYCAGLAVGLIPGLERFHPQADAYRALGVGLITAVFWQIYMSLVSRKASVEFSGEQR
jgi:hypothetical protein